MKTIEMAYIFPFTLMILASLILLSFQLHDMILYKASTYKYIITNSPNSFEHTDDETIDIAPLENYIYKFSLTNNVVKLENNNYSISITTPEYNSNISCKFYDKCDILRKCNIAIELLDSIK